MEESIVDMLNAFEDLDEDEKKVPEAILKMLGLRPYGSISLLLMYRYFHMFNI
jgi:hypothetical protein